MMIIGQKDCRARTASWTESITVDAHKTWFLLEDWPHSIGPKLDPRFFTTGLAKTTAFSNVHTGPQSQKLGTWILAIDGVQIASAVVIREDKPIETVQVILNCNSVHDELGLCLSFLITGVFCFSDADVLELISLNLPLPAQITQDEEIESKSIWLLKNDFIFLKSMDPFLAATALVLTAENWKKNELGKISSEKLKYLRIRRSRINEEAFYKPVRKKRSLIARIFRPRIDD